jgi:hypothetical protein
MSAFKKTALLTFILLIPTFLLGNEFQMKVIKSEEDLPEKFCTIWKSGDYLISNGKNLALIGGVKRYLMSSSNYPVADAQGCIISLSPAGKKLVSDLIIGAPVIRIQDKKQDIFYSTIKSLKEQSQNGTFTVEATALYKGKKGIRAKVQTLYRFFPEEAKVEIRSTLTNTGKEAMEKLDYSIYFSALNRYSFSPFHREDHPDLNFRIYQKKGHYVGLLNMNPLSEEDHIPGTLGPGETFETKHILMVDAQHDSLLNRIYSVINVEPELATIQFKDVNGDLVEIIVRDAFSSSVFFRSFLEDPMTLELPLPEGIYQVKTNFFPAVREELMAVRSGDENSCILQDSLLGTVKVKIQNSEGKFVPGKVTFIGLAPTETPYFEPENPAETEKYWESFKNSVFPEESELEMELPVGTYLVHASRGPEYSVDKKVIEVLEDEPLELTFRIDKVVKTPNLISLDPHMHTTYSDGRMGVAERIRSVVAEGLDVAVATDHNTITDYYPTLKKLRLNEYLAVIPGNEVTISGMIHYNTYPLKHRPEEENNGAISPLSKEVPPLFEASRQKDPGAILQVNHPRSGTLGYFNNYQLDLESAATVQGNFDTSFNVLEVMNGPYYYSSNFTAIEDWLHLLNRGYYFPLVASSDAHYIDRSEPGYSRTYVFYNGEGSDGLDRNALFRAILKGQSFASNGPLIEFKVNNRYTSGDTLTATNRKIDVSVKVWSAPWIAVDEVRLIVNGERRIILPVQTQKESIQKLEEFPLGLTLERDSYLIVEVLGKESLYPILQRSSRSGLSTNATLPYALTNPVFIDVDGNGKFDPPFPEKIKSIPDTGAPKKMISRY